MRFVLLAVATVALVACSSWKECTDLEVTTRNSANQVQWMRYKNARYRVLDTDPFTVEWEYMQCLEDENEAGEWEERCALERQTGPADRVACR